MANQPESSSYSSGILQWETSTPALGGPGGPMNTPLLQLANRTAWLKAQVETFTAAPYLDLNLAGAPTVTVDTGTGGENHVLVPFVAQEDTATMWDTGTSKAVIPVAGVYSLVCSLHLDGVSSKQSDVLIMSVRVGGVEVRRATVLYPPVSEGLCPNSPLVCDLRLAQGSEVQFFGALVGVSGSHQLSGLPTTCYASMRFVRP
jgi:hypothetical protein